MSDKSLEDKFHAYFYSKNTVNRPQEHAEACAAIAAEHYAAALGGDAS